MKNSLHFLLIVSILFFGVTTINCQIINIPADYNTIQEGINAAQNGDTVLVNDGLYYENINFRGKNIVVASRFIIDGNYSHILNTIIDGSTYAIIDSASCVAFVSGENSTAVIQGFTLTGGKGTVYDLDDLNEPQYAGLMTHEGGGVFVDESEPTIKNNLIINNEASHITGYEYNGGGGISSFIGNPQILNNVIINNQAVDNGYASGIVFNKSDGTIRNNVLYNNISDYGGAIYIDIGVGAIIENNTIVENISYTTLASGLSINGTNSVIRNNIIWGNEQIGNIQISGIENSIFEYNNTEETYPGQGNISINPDFLPQNFLLNENSPCVDAGDPGTSFNDKEDAGNPGFALFPSMGALRNDIGAYGGPGAMLLPDTSGIVGVKEEETSISPSSVLLNQNYPNPFNPKTAIKYQIPELSFVMLKVYDVLGNEVVVLVEEEKSMGDYEVDFEASGLASGIYYYQLISNGFVKTKKMLLLK